MCLTSQKRGGENQHHFNKNETEVTLHLKDLEFGKC